MISHPRTDGTLKSRISSEIAHWRRRQWSFEDVGRHWDNTEHYDDINEETYSYFRRFVDGFRLCDLPENSRVLDFCARTGNGILYFQQRGRISSAICADVSAKMGTVCKHRLMEAGFGNFEWRLMDGYDFQFSDDEFDAVLCFESVEHFDDPGRLITELARVTKPGGTVLITTPNVLWEPIHALAAITGLHHSEGPHRFIPYRQLRSMVREAGLNIAAAETTVLVPGGPAWLIRIGEWLERRTQKTLTSVLGLRRILACRKAPQQVP